MLQNAEKIVIVDMRICGIQLRSKISWKRRGYAIGKLAPSSYIVATVDIKKYEHAHV
jgi:hypothetical protein